MAILRLSRWCTSSMLDFFLNSKFLQSTGYTVKICLPLTSNRHHWSNDVCLEGKRENYQVCSMQYCMQQLCTVQCTHIITDLSLVSWLDLAFLWLYCVSQFLCVKFSFLGLLWPPCIADMDIIFLPCDFYLLSFFIPRLISAVADWMPTILQHMM